MKSERRKKARDNNVVWHDTLVNRHERNVRNRLLDALRDRGTIDALSAELARREPLPPAPAPVPRVAPHLLERVRAERRRRFVEVQMHAATRASSNAVDPGPSAWRARLPNGVVLEGSTELVLVIEALAKL